MKTQKERFWGYHQPVIFRLGLALLFCVFFTLGCGVQPQSAYLTDQRFPPNPPSAPVEIFPGVPDRPYILIGEVTAKDMGAWGMADPQPSIAKIKEMARNMGADAIINFKSYHAPIGTVGAGTVTVQGMAVRWKER